MSHLPQPPQPAQPEAPLKPPQLETDCDHAEETTFQSHVASEQETSCSSVYTQADDRNQHPLSGYYQTETHATDHYDARYASMSSRSERSWEHPYCSSYSTPNDSSSYDHVSYDRSPEDSDSYRYDYSNSQGQSGYCYQSNRQDSTSSNCQPQYSYSNDNYIEQNSSGDYQGYSQSNRYKRGYYQDRPYSSSGYRNDRDYSHHDYREYYDSHGSREQSHRSKHKDSRHGESNESSDKNYSRKENESKSNDSFVQRRSAMLKRAQLHQGAKHTKVFRGPQIVKPHRLSDSQLDAKKTKQPEGSFPKRNLDRFKIPKKKNAASATLPAKSSVLIPALDVKENAEQTKLTPSTSIEYSTSSGSSVADSNVTSPPDEKSADAISKMTESKTNESTQIVTSGNMAKKEPSAKVNIASPTVLSTLDPKTLFSLAVTLQRSIEKVFETNRVITLSGSGLFY